MAQALPVPVKTKFKIRNKIRTVDNISGAQVQISDANAVVVSGVTNGHGIVELNLSALADGDYSCAISAPRTYSDPVGPDLLSIGAVPDRVYRPLSLSLGLVGHQVRTATPDDDLVADVAVSGTLVVVDVQPVWMQSPYFQSRGGKTVSSIIIHHTACDLHGAVETFLHDVTKKAAPHYMICPDGQIVKWVQDYSSANHAGYTIDFWNIVGHSDVGTEPDRHLGRKSGDPGLTFEWARLEGRGMGLLLSPGGASDAAMYDGFFQTFPNGVLQLGDNDALQRFGGRTHHEFTGKPIREMQTDLSNIGFSVGKPDGDYGDMSYRALLVFQEHFFAGGRGPTPTGKLDQQTATLIKSVAGREALRQSHR